VQAVVLAGGRGTRLGTDLPKPLVPVAGTPMLYHVLSWLAGEGVTDVVVAAGYRAALIAEAVGDGSRFGLRVSCHVEDGPLGTAGAVRALYEQLSERFFVIYADVLSNVHLGALLEAHLASRAEATLVVHPNDHPFDSDRVIADADGRILRFVPKEAAVGVSAGALCSAALYVVERSLIERIPNGPSDFAREAFPAVLASGAKLQAYRTSEYLKDMGTLDRLAAVEEHLRAGVPRLLRRTGLRTGVLVDRDGVLNEDIPFIADPAKLKLLPGITAAVRRLNKAHVAVACCTNQPVVARGELSTEGLEDVHRHLEGLLGEDGAWLDGIFVCPHHPDRGFPGERIELKGPCRCRKPQPGLLDDAIDRLGLDRRTSILVGDRTTDLAAATASGIVGLGVLSGAACRDRTLPLAPESLLVTDLSAAAQFLLATVPSAIKWCNAAESSRVVLVGGPSRAGKTLVATALRMALQAGGHVVTHVSLDRFILGRAARRPGMPLRDRLGLQPAEEALRALAIQDSVLLPGYDPFRREPGPSRVVQSSRRGILLVDGLLATGLSMPGALTLAVHASDEVLRQRRAEFYRWKGTPPDEGREEEDRAVAEATRPARIHLTVDEDMCLREVA